MSSSLLPRSSSSARLLAEHPLHLKNQKTATSIHDLPVEILSLIFLEVVTDPAKRSIPYSEQKTISSVNRFWHQVIHATPEAWRHFWIRPSLPSPDRDRTAIRAPSPEPSERTEGWLGLEEAEHRLGKATSESENRYANLPISITVDLSGARLTPNRETNVDWMGLRDKIVQLLCNERVMAVWKSIQVWDPVPALFAGDLVEKGSTGPLSPYLERLSVEFPIEQEIGPFDDAIISAHQILRCNNPHRVERGVLRELHLPSIRLTPLPTSQMYSNLVSLHILDHLCDSFGDDTGNNTFELPRLISLCPRLRDLGLRCGHVETAAESRESTLKISVNLGLFVPPFDMHPVPMPNQEVTVHEGVRKLLIYGPTFRCPVIEYLYFPRVEEVTLKGWTDDCNRAPRLPYPPPGTAGGPLVKLIP
ncbi:hypothetical protein FRC01_014823 [Tulasnella sp. 417]|nr:hypothetical protein FRC01_014823 [Tulasnella sp. 417]